MKLKNSSTKVHLKITHNIKNYDGFNHGIVLNGQDKRYRLDQQMLLPISFIIISTIVVCWVKMLINQTKQNGFFPMKHDLSSKIFASKSPC